MRSYVRTIAQGYVLTFSHDICQLVLPSLSTHKTSINELTNSNKQQQHGTCDSKEGKCSCSSSWHEDDCSSNSTKEEEEEEEKPSRQDCIAKNDNTTCSNHGHCTENFLCQCAVGYVGEFCEISLCPGSPKQCSGHGTCTTSIPGEAQGASKHLQYNDTKSLAVSCKCESGWSGPDCGTESIVSPKLDDCDCGEFGICHSGSCHCLDGHHGEKCEKSTCSQGCSSHGKCHQINGEYMCTCEKGWNGTACDTPTCDCENEGSCVNIDGKPVCDCPQHFTGERCEIEVCDPKCSKNAICRNQQCLCAEGYSGATCDVELCIGGCEHGECVKGSCVCDEHWLGEKCTQSTCHSKGTWIPSKGRCECEDPFQGLYCEESEGCASFNECSDHGICKNNRCYCRSGWTGLSCGVPLSSGGKSS